MNYHGACLAKTLFQFNRPKVLTRSLLSMRDEHLFLVKHEHGSFVVEQFLTSQTVPQPRKRKFLSKIEVCYELDLPKLSYKKERDDLSRTAPH